MFVKCSWMTLTCALDGSTNFMRYKILWKVFFWKKDETLIGVEKRPNSKKNPKNFFRMKTNNNRKENHEIVNFSRVFQVYRWFSLYCLVVNKKKEKVGLQFHILFNRSIRKTFSESLMSVQNKLLQVKCGKF